MRSLRPRRLIGAAAVATAAMLAIAVPAQAQTFTVSNLTDSGAEGDGSLRGEVKAANKHEGPDTIVFAPGLSGTITFGGAGVVIDGPLDLEGPGPDEVTIQQTVAHRVFEIEPSGGEAVKIAGLHLADGIAPSSGAHPNEGGNIFNAGASLILEDDLITGGEAEVGGGVVAYEAPFTMRSTTVEDNSATYEGGVSVGGAKGPWSIVDSTISGNLAAWVAGLGASSIAGADGVLEDSTITGNTATEGLGGGILLPEPGGSILVRNSTIAGNTAGEEAAGFAVWTEPGGSITIEGSTISQNTAGEKAGGIEFEGPSATLTLTDTILADNTAATGPDLITAEGSVATAFSLIGDPADAAVTESVPGSDVLGVSPRLEPLRDNGGLTETMALPPGSSSVNKGGSAPSTDQRGDARPVVYPGVPLSSAPGANGADIGAYELQAPPASPPPSPPPPAPPAAPRKPQVRVSCPKGARPGGCRFTLQVFSAKPHKRHGKGKRGRAKPPVAESAVAKVKLAAGQTAVVTLTPKLKFATRLEAAEKVLVREVETVKGSTHIGYRRLKVVR